MRVAALAIAVLVVARVAAQAPDTPHGGGACSLADDCSLGGVCTAGACVCDAWFTGPTCALLNLVPAASTGLGLCGAGMAGYHSWGGRMSTIPTTSLQGSGSGKPVYHGFFSFMCRHKSLKSWTTDSASVHVVSDNLTGPFRFADGDCDGDVCQPAVSIPWSHNTAYARNAPKYAGTPQQELVFHVGNGVVNASEWYPCFNKSQVGAAWAEKEEAGRASHGLGQEAARQAYDAHSAPSGGAVFINTAPSLSGPWSKALGNRAVPLDLTGSWATRVGGNPAPLIFANGSVALYFTASPCPKDSGARAPNCISMAVADAWNGTYRLVRKAAPITYPESEDPFVFQDPRGSFHLLTNVNTYHKRCKAGVPCGGHAWSRDGVTFSNLTIGAFGPVYRLANGTYITNAYVERPFVVQDANRVPLAFYVGMGRSSYVDSCSWAQQFCSSGATGCGPTHPPGYVVG